MHRFVNTLVNSLAAGLTNGLANGLGSRRAQRGQSTLEYVVIVALLAVALLGTQTSAARELAQAVRDFYSNLIFYISLP